MYVERAPDDELRPLPWARYPLGHPDLAGTLNNLGALAPESSAYADARSAIKRWQMFQALYPKEAFPQGHPGPGGQPAPPGLCAP